MKSIVFQFVGGCWDGKTLCTMSPDYEEQLMAAACYETSHHGEVGEACVGFPYEAEGFARRHGWVPADLFSLCRTHRYVVSERRENEAEIVITLTQRQLQQV